MGRSGLRGVVVGALSLVVLQVLVTSSYAGRLAEVFKVPGQLAVRFLDPTVPAIPDRGGAGGDEDDDSGGFRGRSGGLSGLQANDAGGGPVRRYPDPFRVPTSTGGGD